MSCGPEWTNTLSALLTPTIAVSAVVIGLRQWLTAQNKLKLDLFDRRFAMYDAAGKIISSVLGSGTVLDGELHKFMTATHGARWLFDARIKDYFDQQLWAKLIDLQTLQAEAGAASSDEERRKNIRDQREIKDWLREELTSGVDKKFGQFLQLKH